MTKCKLILAFVTNYYKYKHKTKLIMFIVQRFISGFIHNFNVIVILVSY